MYPSHRDTDDEDTQHDLDDPAEYIVRRDGAGVIFEERSEWEQTVFDTFEADFEDADNEH